VKKWLCIYSSLFFSGLFLRSFWVLPIKRKNDQVNWRFIQGNCSVCYPWIYLWILLHFIDWNCYSYHPWDLFWRIGSKFDYFEFDLWIDFHPPQVISHTIIYQISHHKFLWWSYSHKPQEWFMYSWLFKVWREYFKFYFIFFSWSFLFSKP